MVHVLVDEITEVPWLKLMRLDEGTAEALAGIVGDEMRHSAEFPLTLVAQDDTGYRMTLQLDAPGEFGYLTHNLDENHEFLMWPISISVMDAAGKGVELLASSDLFEGTIQLRRCVAGKYVN